VPYFLDGNNLIGKRDPSREDRDALVREIAERLRQTRASAVVFFDGGARRQSSLGPLSIRDGFSDNADDDIVTAIGRARFAREVTVVTSDAALGRRARDAGARVLPPTDFWTRVGRRAAPDKETPKVDLEDWERYFADEKNREK
jgi:YacP-like NYN domain-containing protein